MSLQNVKQYLKKFDLDKKIIEFKTSSATVELAALALNCEPNRIAKTLSFMVDNCPISIVTAGNVKIDNAKFKQTFHTKAKMLNPEEINLLVGHEIGGVCPFAVKENVKVYLDISLKNYETVFPACGSSNSAIELSINELIKTSNYVNWVDVSKI